MELKPFDLILVRGGSPISKLIQKHTNSPYSHVTIVLDQLHLMENSWYFPVSIRHLEYQEESFDVFRPKSLTMEEKQIISKFLMAHINTKYDYFQVFTHWLHLLFDFRIINSNTRFHCAELINEAFQAAGIFLVKGFPTPGEISKSEFLKKVT
ncbi:hypothetical protein BHU72_14440 [Desulfuribacillus stibiiarsenatis]|uniref:Uncharacterized protein n=1 Tax=Desulfuribacillus stibiiarsenatis TaxID=1390249 RepID=A0A1E5L7I7_9FIRM|nr:hypothetical protein [Desulfuribacillus stibiiarsenatis]OEH86117.1 hypothetical protein BHU72_14440 [Desulfuribacillus stibiiarsenatis]